MFILCLIHDKDTIDNAMAKIKVKDGSSDEDSQGKLNLIQIKLAFIFYIYLDYMLFKLSMLNLYLNYSL